MSPLPESVPPTVSRSSGVLDGSRLTNRLPATGFHFFIVTVERRCSNDSTSSYNPNRTVMAQASTILLLTAIIVVGACASIDSTMGSWVGRSIDDVTANWGAPESMMKRTDGGTTYTWTTFNSNQYGTQQCRQSFVTDASRKIVSWSYSGCPRYVKTW